MSENKLGSLIDSLYEKRAKRLALEKEAAIIKREEAELSGIIGGKLAELELDSARGAKATFTPTKSIVTTVVEWENVYDFIIKDNAFDLLQKRISSTAWGDYLDSGLLVPGTEPFEKISYSLTKAKG